MRESLPKIALVQNALKLATYTIEQAITVFGPIVPPESDGTSMGYVAALQAEMQRRGMTFEDMQYLIALRDIHQRLKALQP